MDVHTFIIVCHGTNPMALPVDFIIGLNFKSAFSLVDSINAGPVK